MCVFRTSRHVQQLVGPVIGEQFLFTIGEVIVKNGLLWNMYFSTAKFGPHQKRELPEQPRFSWRGHCFVGDI